MSIFFFFFFLPKVSFIMGTFSDHQHTHPDISYWSRPPPPGPAPTPRLIHLLCLYALHCQGFSQRQSLVQFGMGLLSAAIWSYLYTTVDIDTILNGLVSGLLCFCLPYKIYIKMVPMQIIIMQMYGILVYNRTKTQADACNLLT